MENNGILLHYHFSPGLGLGKWRRKKRKSN